MTQDQLRARRRAIVKRQAVRKLKDTWERKRAAGTSTRKRRGPVADVHDDSVEMPGEDVLDELPDSLIG